ncbi:MAG TPA: hypothetical protein VKB39_07655 [Candidatus Baltobacteraceae bacterium]|nr:hypothetical protein [Candidatus Baltobacteraceae bacterium]
MMRTLTAAVLTALTLIGTAPAIPSDGGNDGFNFLYGTWRTHYRLLRHRLANNHEWYSCEGTSVVRPFWNGDGNLEDGDLRCSSRYVGGLTLRLYDRTTHQWQLWWGTRKLGVVPPPQIGHFDENGTGNFYARDIQEGKHVIIRFRWTNPNGHPHFEQAFSADDGKTWETNWICDYDRVADSSKGVWNAAPQAGGDDGFAFLVGTWHTHYRRLAHPLANDNHWYSCDGTSVVRSFWTGSGSLEDGDVRCPSSTIEGVTLRVYDTTTKQWQLWFGTRTLGLLQPPQLGTFDAHGVGVFIAPDTWHGKHILVRYRWQVRDGHPFFEQAFSQDRGTTWETNWTTVYDRAS